MSVIDTDVMAFEVERALAKGLAIRCETYVCGPTDWRLRIGGKWNLILDREQLDDLHDYASNPAAIKDRFDEIRPGASASSVTDGHHDEGNSKRADGEAPQSMARRAQHTRSDHAEVQSPHG